MDNRPPKLSIVIAAWNGVSLLSECLLSLEKQIENADAEVIVVSNFECELPFPFARQVVFADATVPQLRSHGILAAQGEIIALSEDLCTFDDGWCREIENAHESPFGIIGGAVENTSVKTSLDWAVYLYDYGKYMLPIQPGVTDALSGMNVSYKREILEQVREDYKDGFFETFIHQELKRLGHELFLVPAAIVFHNKRYDFTKTATQFYHQARSFAARRIAKESLLKRLSLILASMVLPILLPLRVVSRALGKQRHFRELLMSLPLLILLMTVWAFGEFCGYTIGEGTSADKWR